MLNIDLPIVEYHLNHATEANSAEAIAQLAANARYDSGNISDHLRLRLTEVLADESVEPRVRERLEHAHTILGAMQNASVPMPSLYDRHVSQQPNDCGIYQEGLLNLSLGGRDAKACKLQTSEAFMAFLTPNCLRELLDNEHTTGVDLSFVPLTREHLDVLGEKARPHIKTLILRGTVDTEILLDDDTYRTFLKAIQRNALPNLEHLDLSDISLMPAFDKTSDYVPSHIEDPIDSSTKTVLLGMDPSIFSPSQRSYELFQAIQSHGSNLKTLKLRNTFTNQRRGLSEGTLARLNTLLMNCQNIEELDLSGNELGISASLSKETGSPLYTAHLFANMACLERLKVLHLASNEIGPRMPDGDALRCLSEMLCRHVARLTYLDLSGNAIERLPESQDNLVPLILGSFRGQLRY